MEENNELYKALEELNKEKYVLKNSKEYKIGNNIKETLVLLFKLKFNKLFKNISNKKAKKKIYKRYYNPDNFEYLERRR